MAINTAPTFVVGDGIALNGFGTARAMVLLPDGKIVLAGTNGGSNYRVTRFNNDGSLDTTFNVANGVPDSANDLALQADGRIVMAVFDRNEFSRNVLVRLNVSGSLDTTFSGDGRLSVPSVGQVEIQADGKIVAAAARATLRFNTDGSIDTSFGNNGFVVDGPQNGINALALQSDGRILVTGINSTSRVDVVRYNADGTRDATFSGDGLATIPVAFTPVDIFLQADGKVLIGGTVSTGVINHLFRMTVVRLNTDGSLDTTFDADGRASFEVGASDTFSAGTVQPDGKILIAGTASTAGRGDFAVLRLNGDGSLDTTFDGDGKVVTNLASSSSDLAVGIAVQPDDRIVVGGWTDSGGTRFAAVRYNTDGSLDRSFDGVNTLNGDPTYTGKDVPAVLDSDAHVYDAQLAAQGHYAGASVTLQRHGGANADDVYTNAGLLGALIQGRSFTYAGVSVGTVTTNSGGVLVLTFNSSATQARVDSVLESIAYSNHRQTTAATVHIDWNFSDHNTGAQGTGGALEAIGSSSVFIAPNGIVPWSALTNGQAVHPFDADADVLRFDSTAISAARVSVASGVGGASTLFSFGGKTVSLDMPLTAVTTANVTFDDGSALVVGGDTTGTVDDNAANALTGTAGNDQLVALGGDDTLTGGAGGDRLDGGAGRDTARYDTAPAGIVAGLQSRSHNTGHAAGDSYVSIEDVVGSLFNDTLAGDANVNGLTGLDGNDYLQGLGGNDALDGGNGDDELEGGAGADSLTGGAGFDYAKYKYAASAVAVDLATPGVNGGEAAGDTFSSIEGVIGSAFADVLYGNAAANDLAGSDGNDTLLGRAGDDNLQGMNGNDTLDGGPGTDRLNGGNGNDTFLFNRGEANGDAIVDFNGNGAAAGDDLVFQGYGSGATFTQVDATHWSINSSSGSEIITIANDAAIDPSDYTFI